MAKKYQIRGMILEEVLLWLLRGCGYKTVTTPTGDSTLKQGRSGLEVRGRGGDHQIDAIADSLVRHPFSNAQRLLLEAKYTKKSVGIPVIRNAYGVLRDVSEYWAVDPASRSFRRTRARYHYQYAVASASGFSEPAQDYAFAQDIYLLPLGRNAFFKGILDVIATLAEQLAAATAKLGSLSEYRKTLRSLLERAPYAPLLVDEPPDEEWLELELLQAIRNVGQPLIALIDNRFPIFLVSNPELTPNDWEIMDGTRPVNVRIFYRDNTWFIRTAVGNKLLFSFDLPKLLFHMYAESGKLTHEAALRMKDEQFTMLQAYRTINNRVELITFELDRDWIASLRRHQEPG